MKLSEMKASPDVGRPERTFDICVSGKLAAKLAVADRAFYDAETRLAEARAAAEPVDEDSPIRPRRLAQRSVDPVLEQAAQDAAAECDRIRGRMAEHTVTLTVRASEFGKWRQWASQHPARDEDTDPAGHARDERYAAGICNVDALIPTLGDYVIDYGGEQPEPDSWAFIEANASPGDLTMLASIVVGLHEQVVDLGKSRVAWHADRQSVLGSV